MSTTIRDLDLETLVLKPGVHSPDGEFCVMEAVSYIAGEPWSDSPECASPVISALLRNWNDSLDDDDRQMLKPLIPKLVNSKGSREVESRRAWLALDWLIRVQTPAWLRLATLNEVADELEKLPPVVSAKAAQAALPTLSRAQERSDAAWAAGGAAWAAGAAAWAAWAARDAAWDAARDAAWDAAGAAAWATAGAAAWATAGAAAGAAAWDAGVAVRPTVETLQRSALELVDRMLAVQEAVPSKLEILR